MQKYILIFLLISAVFISCSEDYPNILNHDGDNRSAPFLEAGTHKAGTKFDANDLEPYIGRFLEEIHFYMLGVPVNAIVEVYGEGTDNEPGSLILSEDIGSNMAQQSWNAYILDPPLEITGQELWLCITVTHDSNLGSIGCDPGPAVENGDWFRPAGTLNWETFRNFSGGETSINWNIRGILNEE